MPETKLEIAKITMPSGTTYWFKDKEARDRIEQIVSGGVTYIGKTTTALTDGSTTNPIQIDGQSVTAVNGNLVVYEQTGKPPREFIWLGTSAAGHWNELGGGSGVFGALAYKDSASGSYTKPTGSGSVSVVEPTGTFSGTRVQTTLSGNTNLTSKEIVTAVSPTTKYLSAEASGGEVEVTGTISAITSLGTPTTISAVTGAQAATGGTYDILRNVSVTTDTDGENALVFGGGNFTSDNAVKTITPTTDSAIKSLRIGEAPTVSLSYSDTQATGSLPVVNNVGVTKVDGTAVPVQVSLDYTPGGTVNTSTNSKTVTVGTTSGTVTVS